MAPLTADAAAYMARITEAALDDTELKRLHATRPANRPTVRAPAIAGVATTAIPILSLVLIVGGTGALLAPTPVPFPGVLLGIGALVLGGWFAGRVGRSGEAMAERVLGATFAERRDVIRAAVAVAALRGDDGAARRAQPAVARAAVGEYDQTGGDGGGIGRAPLRAVQSAGSGSGESLDADADAAVLGGG